MSDECHELRREIKQRCEAAGLDFVEFEWADDSEDEPIFKLEEGTSWLSITLPRGEDFASLMVCASSSCRALLNEPFEKYRLLEDYRALWSPELRIIECALDETNASGFLVPPTVEEIQTMTETLTQLDASPILGFSQRVVLESNTDLTISIGPASNTFDTLMWINTGSVLMPRLSREATNKRSLTLQIEGIATAAHDAAVDFLQQLGDSLFFQLDLSLGLPLTLMRDSNRNTAQSTSDKLETASPLPPIEFQYDRQPLSLYKYARTASAMPLLQFLAYYQVLEFYFYRYLKRKAEREIIDILEELPFKQLPDADKSRLLNVIRHRYEGGRKLGGSERDLLETTIKECVTLYDLRSFIVENDDRYKYYTSTTLPKALSRYVIPILDASPDHRVSAAERVYDIRCRIVHAKTGFETQGPLFPFDPETANLRHDIDLVQFLARRAIEKARRPL